MSKMFAVLAVLLILTGALILAVPREVAPISRGPAVQTSVSLFAKARDVAEQVNAPLSILFGLISLFYSRRTYLAQSNRKDGGVDGHRT